MSNVEQTAETLNLLQLILSKVTTLIKDVEELKINQSSAVEQNQGKSEQDFDVFHQETLLRLKELEKDFRLLRRQVKIDLSYFAQDLLLLEARLEKVELKLEIKN